MYCAPGTASSVRREIRDAVPADNLPGGLAPHELAKRAGVTRATVTGLLDGLERDGFLSRHCDNEVAAWCQYG
jgi:DNA-binding MarR family transcriptional regulator